MEQEQSDPQGSSPAAEPGTRGDGSGASSPAPRGRHDILESEDNSAFWPEVDGMLTGEFSADLLPKLGDYTLGAIDESAVGSKESGPRIDPKEDPFAFDLANTASVPAPPNADGMPPAPPAPAPPAPAPPAPAPPGAGNTPPAPAPPTVSSRGPVVGPDEATGPVERFNGDDFPPPVVEDHAAGVRRGAHDIDPDQLGFNVVPEDDESFGSFVPDLDDGPFAVSKNEAPETRLFDSPANEGPANEVPTVSTSSARLFDELGKLPAVAEDDGGRLFPPKSDVFGNAGPAAPTVAAGSPPPPLSVRLLSTLRAT